MRIISNGRAVLVFNGRAVLVFNGRAVLVINGGAVLLDSQGCQPLVSVPTTYRESRSDGIGLATTFPGHTHNATAPPFRTLRGTVSRGSHPWLPNTIAPRFNFVTRLRTEVADAIDT